MDLQPSAPPVVAVVVAHDPGAWFEEALGAIAAQDYPNLSVLVLDAGSEDDLTPRVASVAPRAFVRRLAKGTTYVKAANEALSMVEGAAHLLLCHDDVAPDPDALRLLVEEAYRSNAGIISPKYVAWDDPSRLIAVGLGADRMGVVHPLNEEGERDQEQHDAVRDVFVAPGGATLLRADLLESLGGYDTEAGSPGEDLDLCWRAQVAGARVMVAPQARVRHLRATQSGRRSPTAAAPARRARDAERETNRLRSLWVCASLASLLLLSPLVVLHALIEAAWALLRGHPGDAPAPLTALARSWRRPRQLLALRRRTQRARRVHDRELRRLQSRGSARLRGFFRHQLESGDELIFGHEEPEDLQSEEDDIPRPRRRRRDVQASDIGRRGNWRYTASVAFLLVVVLAIGSRGLLSQGLPDVGQLPTTVGGVGGWWHAWWSTSSPVLLGGRAAASPALGLLALVGTVLLGSSSAAIHLVVLAPLALGPFGAYRAARPYGSPRGRVAAMVAYAVVPVPYNALAQGHWAALITYAVAPWLLGLLARVGAEAPLPELSTRGTVSRLLALVLVLAAGASVAPVLLLIVPVIGVALAVGGLLAGQRDGALRFVVGALVASLGAIILLSPWSLDVLRSRTALIGARGAASGALGLGHLLRFQTGPWGTSPLDWGIVVAAVLALAIGRSWRLVWASRLWMVAITCIGLEWAGARGWLPVPLPAPELLLAPAAAALSMVVALGAAAFELDLPGYRFGWRQLASALAAVGVLAAALPLLGGLTGGRWKLPAEGAESAFSFPAASSAGDYRVLWWGSPAQLPTASRWLADGIGYATSLDGTPAAADLWVPGRLGAAAVLGQDLRWSDGQQTTELGHLLAPMAIRYVVVPAGSPAVLTAGLQRQLDLDPVGNAGPYAVYANASWSPLTGVLSPGSSALAAQAGAQPAARAAGATAVALQAASVHDTAAPLPLRRAALQGPGSVYVASAANAGWKVTIDGQVVRPRPAFGWAEQWPLPSSGLAVVSARAGTPLGYHLWQLLIAVAAAAALAVVAVDARARSVGRRLVETVDARWFEPLAAGSIHFHHRRTGAETDISRDELWEDA